MVTNAQQHTVVGDALYDRLAKPLEVQQWGKFIAIAENGDFLLRDSLVDLLEAADTAFTESPFVFKIGEKAVGRWHRPIG